MAGVPFDALDRLATRETARLAREYIVRQDDFAKATAEVESVLASRRHNLSKELFRAWRKTIRSGTMPPAGDQPSQAFAHCWECASRLADVEARLEKSLERELTAARVNLFELTRTVSSRYLVFGGAGVREMLAGLLIETPSDTSPLPPRKKRERARERHLLLYLQRICAKNDTLSEFGPGGWGTIEGTAGIKLAPEPGIAKRETFFERWTALAYLWMSVRYHKMEKGRGPASACLAVQMNFVEDGAAEFTPSLSPLLQQRTRRLGEPFGPL